MWRFHEEDHENLRRKYYKSGILIATESLFFSCGFLPAKNSSFYFGKSLFVSGYNNNHTRRAAAHIIIYLAVEETVIVMWLARAKKMRETSE